MSGDVLDQFRLGGRVAIVTGGTRGLGRAIVEALASAGAAVALTGRDVAGAQGVATQISAAHRAKVAGFGVDVRDAGRVHDLVAEIHATFGGVDILVNNAGITERGALEALTPERWAAVLDTNLTGAWHCCRAAAASLRDSGAGRIVNVSSMLSAVGLENRSAYIASKGGLTSLTRALAVELAPSGITVNAICPGPFETEMADAAARAGMLEQIPLRRWGRPAELGAAVVFLASAAAGYITGTTLTIDGGYTAR